MVTLRPIENIAPRALGGRANSVRSPSDLIDAAIAYVNGEIAPNLEERTERFQLSEDDDTYVAYLQGKGGQETELEVISKEDARKLAAWDISKEREFATLLLNDAATSRSSLVARIKVERLAGTTTGVVSTPLIAFQSDGKISINWELKGPNVPTGWVLFAAGLIAEDAIGEHTEIGRCKLKQCGRFFRVVIKGRGKPRRDYCCEPHMLEAHARGSTERARLSRAKKKAEAAKPRRRRRT